jgi:hypothetical protein
MPKKIIYQCLKTIDKMIVKPVFADIQRLSLESFSISPSDLRFESVNILMRFGKTLKIAVAITVI